MKIVVHSAYSQRHIETNLGKAEYSYYFVLAGYLAALRQLGEVVMVEDAETEVDAIYDIAKASGEACVFLCFALPHLVPITLRCPTIPVIAWEFSTIPCESWSDDPRSDWRVVFAHCKRVITLSQHTARLVREAMGEDFPVFVIPAACFEAFCGVGMAAPPAAARSMRLRGYLFDSATDPCFQDNPSWPPQAAPHFGPLPPEPVPQPAPVVAASPPLAGLRKRISVTVYYLRSWYREVVRDILPRPVSRLVSLAGRGLYRGYRLVIPRAQPAEPPPPVAAPAPPPLPQHEVTLRGVVYTSVLSPQDGRKNWQDLLSGFVWAFRNTPDATLFLKMPVRGGLEAYGAMHAILTRFAPFRCRVVFFAGYLDDAEYQALVAASSYYANCSHAEGLCLPLVEFLSAGRPAVAPDHTGMADYITPEIAFVLRASLEHNVWPFDPREQFTTMRYRLNWESLVDAFAASHAVALSDTARYAAMSAAAIEAMRGFCTQEMVRAKLARALGLAPPDLNPAMAEAGMVVA